jgi:hypothetical protein
VTAAECITTGKKPLVVQARRAFTKLCCGSRFKGTETGMFQKQDSAWVAVSGFLWFEKNLSANWQSCILFICTPCHRRFAMMLPEKTRFPAQILRVFRFSRAWRRFFGTFGIVVAE